jgi:hypothetical protein
MIRFLSVNFAPPLLLCVKIFLHTKSQGGNINILTPPLVAENS